MAYLFSTILDELKQNDIQLICAKNEFDKINRKEYILCINKNNEFIIQMSINKYHYFSKHCEYYRIPQDLSSDKIINIILFVLNNDYLNRDKNTNLTNNYVAIYYNIIGTIQIKLTNKINKIVPTYKKIFYFKSNTKSMVSCIFEKYHEITIYYEY